MLSSAVDLQVLILVHYQYNVWHLKYVNYQVYSVKYLPIINALEVQNPRDMHTCDVHACMHEMKCLELSRFDHHGKKALVSAQCCSSYYLTCTWFQAEIQQQQTSSKKSYVSMCSFATRSLLNVVKQRSWVTKTVIILKQKGFRSSLLLFLSLDELKPDGSPNVHTFVDNNIIGNTQTDRLFK